MPIYEYRCERCGHQFERWQKITDPDPLDCPKCHAKAPTHLISAVGFRLKGGGWYETDFKRANRHNLAGEGEAAGKQAEQKPAADAEKGKVTEKPSGDQKAAKTDKKPKTKRGEAQA